METQKPRAATIESLTATLYYTSGGRQAKADRCTIALQRSQNVAGRCVVAGNWYDFEEQLIEMDKESGHLMTCDFDLVLKEQQAADPATQPAAQAARSTVRARPGIVTAIMEEGLAGVVTNERSATGSAIGIRDYWRCQDEGCKNNPGVCWVRRPPGRQIDRDSDHYPLNGNIISNWASAIARQLCTIEEPSDDIQLQIRMAKDRNDRENKRRRRKVSPTSSNSSIEYLTKAILVGQLAQLKQPQQCQHHLSEPLQRPRWVDINSSHFEMIQHNRNFFNYWKLSMPHLREEIKAIYSLCKKENFNINMLMDPWDGMTMDLWTQYYEQSPRLLSHLRRKAHDWIKDYSGLSKEDIAVANRFLNGERDSPVVEYRLPLTEVSGN